MPPEPSHDDSALLRTTAGDFPLHEYHLRAGGRAWSIVHTGAVLSHDDESRFLRDLGERELGDRMPYGVALWPAAIALAHDLIARADALPGTRLLELGAGTGLPGIVAATLGARVVQTDRQPLALRVCARNAARNGAAGIEQRAADWGAWDDAARYDWIVGSDILYATSAHDALRRIFAANLAPGGRVLLSDPFRATSLALLEAMEADGWRISLGRWRVGEDASPRGIGVYELAAPAG